MPRRKMEISFIEDKNEREAIFKKATNSLFKTVQELSILCGVDACCIVYSTDDPNPECWPPRYFAAMDVVSRFMNLPTEERSRKMLNQEGYAEEMIGKLEEKLKKIKNNNRDKYIRIIINHILSGKKDMGELDAADLKDVMRESGIKVIELSNKMDPICVSKSDNGEVPNAATAMPMDSEALSFDLNEAPDSSDSTH